MEIKESNFYTRWYSRLKDAMTKARIDRRVKLASRGVYGDVKPVGDGVRELRFHFGPGYRVYCKEVNGLFFLLLAGGTKKTQSEDIDLAKEIAKHF